LKRDGNEGGDTVAPVRVWQIAATAVCGHALTLSISILVARRLGIEQFEAYAVSASAFLLMVSVAPLGLDKYSVRILPALIERRDFSRAHGFIRFGIRAILGSAIVIAGGGGIAVWLGDRFDSSVTAALFASCLALPAGALAHFCMEVMTALGHERRATVVFRLFVPIITLAAFVLMILMWGKVAGAAATAAWGVGWVCAVAILAMEIRRSAPAELWTRTPQAEPGGWVSDAFPFLAYRGVLALLSQSSILMLSIMDPSPKAVGAYAVAVAVTAPVVALLTATNRAYGRRLSISLERRDYNAIYEVRRARLRWAIPAIAGMLIISLAFPRQLTGLFGLQHSHDAVASLRILALAGAFTIIFSLAPTYIKFTGARRLMLVAGAGAVLCQSALLTALVPLWGATGAAVAHGSAMVAMYGVFALIAWRDLLRRRVMPRQRD
jgi:O-antigen/teichoic acid export membrane protein